MKRAGMNSQANQDLLGSVFIELALYIRQLYYFCLKRWFPLKHWRFVWAAVTLGKELKKKIFWIIFIPCPLPFTKILLSYLSVHWGSEIRPFEILKHLKSVLFEDLISNGSVFNDLGCSLSLSYGSNHLKTRPLQNLYIFVWILNGFWLNGSHLSGFQMVGLL